MTGRAGAALQVWTSRKPRSAGERAYLAYSVFLAGLVVVVPAVRALWGAIGAPAAQAALASPSAAAAAVWISGLVWAAALLAGRSRGPAMLPPFPTYALAGSDLSRSRVYRRPMVGAVLVVAVVTTAAAALIAGSMLAAGAVGLTAASVFALAGMLVGLLGAVAWLAGQAFPRASAPTALAVAALAGLVSGVPALWPLAPWGWVGLAFPAHPAASAAALLGLGVLSVAALALVPALLNRLATVRLVAQSVRWERATAHASILDVGAAARDYQPRPGVGRRLTAVRPMRWRAATFLLRDAVGAARTPGRLLAALAALVAAGVLLLIASLPGAAVGVLGCLAGLLAFAGLGPLTDGIRHAADVAAGASLYGIGDGWLLASHAAFPAVVAAAVLVLVAIVGAALLAGPGLLAVLQAGMLGALALLARVAGALKGPLPPALLTPIPTPVGDLAAAARVLWSVDTLLLAAGAGFGVALLIPAPPLVALVAAILLALTATRWLRR